jgi:hypothetical protein
VSKKQKVEPSSPEVYKTGVPMQGPFTDLGHPELYATEPSTGKRGVTMQCPLLPVLSLGIQANMQNPVTDLAMRCDARIFGGVLPRPAHSMPNFTAYPPPCSNSDVSEDEVEDVGSEDVASNVSTRANNENNEDTVTVQFSSICSPFLATSHIPCSQSYHIRTTPH